MKKTFITVVPFQPEGQLKPLLYIPQGNSRLVYDYETRFPIIPVINGYAEKGDRIRIIYILTDGENFKNNFQLYLKPEIDAIAEKKELLHEEKIIRTKDSEDIDSQLKLFLDITEAIDDGDEIYACTTFGTKPTPLVETLALNYAYKLKKEISIGCIVYGRFDHASKQGAIYDTTALFYMDSIINKLAEAKAPNPEAAIRALLGIGGDDNDEQ